MKVISVLILSSCVVAQVPESRLTEYGLPTTDKYLVSSEFLYSVDNKTKNPRWVIETLDKQTLMKRVSRRGLVFKTDQRIPIQTRVNARDYRSSGYDIGHMAPAADHSSSITSLADTFVFTNACPQLPEYNRGIWAGLEDGIRDTTNSGVVDSVWVVTAPIYEHHEPQTIGNRVWIPSAFGKAILIRFKDDKLIAHAWILPHSRIALGTKDEYKITTDEFERRTGFDVWSKLPDNVETALEKQ